MTNYILSFPKCFVCLFVFIWGDSLLSFRRTPNKGAWSIPIGPCHRLMRCLCILIAPTGNRTRACCVTGEDFGTAPRVWPNYHNFFKNCQNWHKFVNIVTNVQPSIIFNESTHHKSFKSSPSSGINNLFEYC